MKKAFNECYKAVVNCEEEATGRKRCELFRDIPDRRVCTFFPHTKYCLPFTKTWRRSILITTN